MQGMRVVSLESRRAQEMARLIERYGGVPIVAPSMREVPLSDQAEALRFGEVLLSGGCDVLVLLTGVGTRMLVDALATRTPCERVIEALGNTTRVCRGPKPVAALKALGLGADVRVPEPNTWRDVLETLDRDLEVAGKRVFVQEYGVRNEELLAGLRERGAEAESVPVYGWTLPEDVRPLQRAIEALVEGRADVVIFTSQKQVDNLMTVARRAGREQALREALGRVLVASIGPVTSEGLRGRGIAPDLEPERPKMGHLVQALAGEGRARLQDKRRDA